MKKNIIISLLAVVFLIGTVFGYKKINRIFPSRELKTIEKGSEIEFRDGIDISVSKMRWLSEEEKKVLSGKNAFVFIGTLMWCGKKNYVIV